MEITRNETERERCWAERKLVPVLYGRYLERSGFMLPVTTLTEEQVT